MSTEQEASQLTTTDKSSLSAEQITQYLKENPDFFLNYPTLITDLNFGHETGNAVSLIQRQVELLRKHHDTMRKRLADLTTISKNNESLLERIKTLSVSAAAANTPKAILESISQTIIQDFGLDAVYLVVEHNNWPMSATNVIGLSPEELGNLRNSVYNLAVFVGRPSEKLKALLSITNSEAVASIAMTRLKYKEVDTYLVIGSKDKDRFTSDMGTEFVSYIGELLQALLSR